MNTLVRFSLCAVLAVGIAMISSNASAQWSDGFESYTNGQILDGDGGDDGGWEGWDGNPAFAGVVTTEQARTGILSVKVGTENGNCDAVHPFVGEFVSDRVVVTAYIYLTEAELANGDTYFILNNAYDGTGVGYFWTTQIHFQGSNNNIVCEANGGGGFAPIVFDEWVQIRVLFDMDTDTQLTFYDGNMVSTGMVTSDGTQPLEIANIDLFTLGATTYYDDMSIVSCVAADVNGDGNVDLLDVDPFVNLLSGGAEYNCAADVNFDGANDLLDVAPFVEALTGG